MSSDERVWDLSIDGQCEDDSLVRIDDADWEDYEDFLDPLLVGLALSTKHFDAKITLSRQLIEIHQEHARSRETAGNSNVAGLLPEKVLDRLVYGMLANCAADAPTPNVLLRLLALRLGVSEKPRKSVRFKVRYRNLIHLVAKNPGIGKKKAAEAVGVSPNTAKKWMDEAVFKEAVVALRQSGTRAGQLNS
jgi:hypothetical protein